MESATPLPASKNFDDFMSFLEAEKFEVLAENNSDQIENKKPRSSLKGSDKSRRPSRKNSAVGNRSS